MLILEYYGTKIFSEHLIKHAVYGNDDNINEDLEDIYLTTTKGNYSLSEINSDVYKPLGYKIIGWCSYMPCVTKIKKLDCKNVFNEWSDIGSSYDRLSKPKANLTKEEMPKFTLNHHIPIHHIYMNDKNNIKEVFWSKSEIDELTSKTDPTKILQYYIGNAEALYYATKRYSIENKEGLIIGSVTPWAEAYCLKNGAKKVTTIEYNNIVSKHPQINYINALEFAKVYKKYLNYADFVVTYSSIEHSGLGRYGDPYDPIGDIREMQKIFCWLKPGGLLFVGIPVGRDYLVFNIHRFYGQLRLPLLISDFKLLDVFYGKRSTPIKFDKKYFNKQPLHDTYQQMVFVLQKI